MLVKTIGLSGAACMLFCATTVSATTYDAFGQFVIAGGTLAAPNFKYGYAPKVFSDSITPFTIFEGPNCGGDANLTCAHLSPAIADALGIYKPTAGFNGDGVYAPGAASNHYENGFLNLHPAHDYWGYAAAVQFIAPSDGDYSFTGLFRNMDNGLTQRVASAYVSTTNIFATTFTNADQSFDFTAALLAGETVTFLVNAGNDNYFNDSTGLKLQVASLSAAGPVPEPASWALMICGFVLAGMVLRRRKIRIAYG